MKPEEFFDRSINSLIGEIIKLREYHLEDARVFIEDDNIFVVLDGALFSAKNGEQLRCIGDSQAGVGLTVPCHIATAVYNS